MLPKKEGSGPEPIAAGLSWHAGDPPGSPHIGLDPTRQRLCPTERHAQWLPGPIGYSPKPLFPSPLLPGEHPHEPKVTTVLAAFLLG